MCIQPKSNIKLVFQMPYCSHRKPNPLWFLNAYSILSWKSCGELWYFVGIVISRAHVDAVGNSNELQNLMVGSVSNPSGGGYSAPVKKLKT